MEAARVNRFKRGSGIPIKTPVVNMIEVGAGGGSIARIDEVGLLRVGPMSAGAAPGPVCYDKGGTEPTVTDANLVLGYYDPDFFLGGRMRLNADAAEKALAGIGTKLGPSAIETAQGIHRVVTETMAAAVRIHLVEKGRDPRRYAIVGFGGAGPAHAAEVARIIGARKVVIPPASGAASAPGFLVAAMSFETVRSHPIQIDSSFEPESINQLLNELEAEAREPLIAAGIAAWDITVERLADMRLVGQIHEIAVPLPLGAIDFGSVATIRCAFEKVYAARYTSVVSGADIEAINFRVRCTAPAPDLRLQANVGAATSAAKRKGVRLVHFGNGFVETQVYDRYTLIPGDRVDGPAIIEEREATTIVPPGDVLSVDERFNMHIAISVAPIPVEFVTPAMSNAAAIERIDRDPVTLEIMWSHLVSITEEMWETICRTAFSLIISESQDFATELLDANGETLAHSPRAMPVFNLTLPWAVTALLKRFPPQSLLPGDVLVTNDPWLCAGHLFDVAIVTPVFRQDRR
jgi:5-oxoprolinase (ATP-hydrolysing)